MIEKAFLPVWFHKSEREQFFTQDGSKRLNPFAQRDAFRRQHDKEMNMIWHDNIAPDGNIISSARMQKSQNT